MDLEKGTVVKSRNSRSCRRNEENTVKYCTSRCHEEPDCLYGSHLLEFGCAGCSAEPNRLSIGHTACTPTSGRSHTRLFGQGGP